MTLECEIKLKQDDIIKVGNEYDQTVEFKEVSIKTLKDAVTNIKILLDKWANKMEGEIIFLEITVNESKVQLKVIKSELDESSKIMKKQPA